MTEEELMAAMEAAQTQEEPREETTPEGMPTEETPPAEEQVPEEEQPALEQALEEQANPLEQLDQGPMSKYEIVINPDVYVDERDALAVAWDEALRCVMEEMAFTPINDPTQKQRNFFADTAYANDETMLRRTIMARIATFDDSITDPQPEQIEETVEFLLGIQEAGIPRSEEEQATVQRMITGLKEIYEMQKERPQPEEEPGSDMDSKEMDYEEDSTPGRSSGNKPTDF